MKKVVLLVLCILISGCDGHFLEDKNKEYKNKFIEKGFNEEEALIFNDFNDETKDLILNNPNKTLDLINIKSTFDEDYLIDYLNSNYDINTFIYVKEHVSDSLRNRFNSFYKDDFFILNNTDLYFKYYKDFVDTRSLIEYVNTKAYKIPYEEYEKSDTSKGIYMIASKRYYLDNYVPDDLVKVEKGYYVFNVSEMKKEAFNAFKDMADAARLDNIYFYISSGYRSYDLQEKIYSNYLKKDTKENVDSYSSRSGFSDHQIGLSCDIRTKDINFDNFKDSKESSWLIDNAYKYGFILRYPEGKDDITGYMYESWHYRYVGLEASYVIHETGITFDEYYAYYVENN